MISLYSQYYDVMVFTFSGRCEIHLRVKKYNTLLSARPFVYSMSISMILSIFNKVDKVFFCLQNYYAIKSFKTFDKYHIFGKCKKNIYIMNKVNQNNI